jgi:hypothetical protein
LRNKVQGIILNNGSLWNLINGDEPNGGMILWGLIVIWMILMGNDPVGFNCNLDDPLKKHQ